MAKNNAINNQTSLLDYDTGTANPTYAEGRTFYNDTDKCVSYFTSEADIKVNLGQQTLVRVYNDSGAQIDKGKIVYADTVEVVENRPTVELARANALATSRILGAASHDIGNGEFGFVTQFGVVAGFDTSAFLAGDDVYLSTATAGNLQTAVPTAPDLVVYVGQILVSDASDGQLFVTATGITEGASGSFADTALSNLASVAINTSLISDTDNTDDLGTQAIRWRNVYAATIQSGDTAADTLQLGAWDVDGAAFVPFITFTSDNDPTCALADGVTAVTQSANDNSTKVATTEYVDAASGGGTGEATAKDITQANSFSVGDAIYHTGSAYALADASSATTADVIGVVSAATGADFTVVTEGYISGLSGLTAGSTYFLSTTGTSGSTLTATAPTGTGEVNKPVLLAVSTTEAFVVPYRGVVVGGTSSGPTQTLIDSQTASASATLEFTTGIDSSYDYYVFRIHKLVPATDAVYLYAQVSTDTGATWKTGASDYSYMVDAYTTAGVQNAAHSNMPLTYTTTNFVGNDAGNSVQGFAELHNPGDASLFTSLLGKVGYLKSDTIAGHIDSNSIYLATTAVDAVRFLFSSGNIASGTIYLYGVTL